MNNIKDIKDNRELSDNKHLKFLVTLYLTAALNDQNTLIIRSIQVRPGYL